MQKNLVKKIFTLTLCAIIFIPNISSANSDSFKASKRTVVREESVGLIWNVPSATICYLYGPTSKEPNVPDTYRNKESITVTPTKERSDWSKGKRATYSLTCLNENKLNSDGNFTQVFSKKISIKLSEPKKEKVPNGLTQRVSSSVGTLGAAVSINPPRTWVKTDSIFDFIKEIEGMSRTASISLEQLKDTTWKDTKMNFVSSHLESYDTDAIASGSTKINAYPAVYVEFEFDGAHYKVYAFSADSEVYQITTQVPISQWGKYKTIISRSLKTLRIGN